MIQTCSGNHWASTAVILVCTGWPLSSLLKLKHIRLLRRRPTHVGVWSLIICLSFKGLSRQLKICGIDPPCYSNMRTTRSLHIKLRLCWIKGSNTWETKGFLLPVKWECGLHWLWCCMNSTKNKCQILPVVSDTKLLAAVPMKSWKLYNIRSWFVTPLRRYSSPAEWKRSSCLTPALSSSKGWKINFFKVSHTIQIFQYLISAFKFIYIFTSCNYCLLFKYTF